MVASMFRKLWLDPWALVALVASLCAIAAVVVDIRIHAPLLGPNAEGEILAIPLMALPLVAMAVMGRAVIAYRRRAIAQVEVAERAKAQLQRSLESIRDGFCIWSSDGRLVTWNRRYAEITCYLRKPLQVGMPFAELVRDAAQTLHPHLDDAGREAWARSREAALARADAAPRHFTTPTGHLIEVVDQRTDEGDVVTNLRDVTEERLAQRRLAESEARFRDGIESMADGFMLWDAEDRLIAWNRRAIEMLPHLEWMELPGSEFETFVRRAIANARPDWSDAQLSEWVRLRIERRRRGETNEIHLCDGTVIETTVRPTSQGGHVTILHDVTADRRAQLMTEKALAAERETNLQQRRFVSIAGHEFRTPLAIIDSTAQRLEARLDRAPAVEIRLRLNRIREAITRMTGIIDMTLTSARLDEGRITLQPSCFDLVLLAREVIARQRALSPRYTIALEAPGAGAEITADRALTDQILTNLLSNAVKYSPLAHDIDVTIAVEADQAVIAVRDYGVGIPADEIPKLFTRFFRARTAAGFQGTGIGLHLVRELVDLHGGCIDVLSRPGHGSTFTVRLPLAQPAAEPLRVAS
jgi:signal transduction histidine kinase